MKTILLGPVPPPPATTEYLNNTSETTPIFLVKDGKIQGILSHQMDDGKKERRWIGRIGMYGGINGYFDTREECLRNAISFGYTPVIDIQIQL